MRKFNRNRIRKTKKQSDEYRRTVMYGGIWLLAFVVLLITVLSVKTVLKSGERKTENIPELVFDDTYKITVHNHTTDKTEKVSLEEYIFHVVAAEMPASYDLEALKAQAVAARTYAVRKAKDIMGESACECNPGHWDICTSSACCQAWKSLSGLRTSWGSHYGEYVGKVYSAVIETSGIIITYDGKPINAMFHSSSGGRTSNVEDVYGGDPVPYLKAVDSPGEEKYSGYSSTVKLTKAEAVKILNDEFGQKLTKNNIDKNFSVLKRNDSGHVLKVRVGTKNVTGRDMRHIFSLKSSNFTITFSDKYVIINVKGYGHGVGMSQSGAGAMAQSGSVYTEILTHYYQGVTVENLEQITH